MVKESQSVIVKDSVLLMNGIFEELCSEVGLYCKYNNLTVALYIAILVCDNGIKFAQLVQHAARKKLGKGKFLVFWKGIQVVFKKGTIFSQIVKEIVWFC